MATLKDKINRILGNNVRLQLPSYWWKRLFGLVIDRIDEVENNTRITVDSELSKTSKNAVQNKVIAEEIEAIAEEFDKQQCVFVVGSDGTAPENYKQQNKESYNKVYEAIDADRWMNVFVLYSVYFRIQVDSITISGSTELVLYATFDDSFIRFIVSSDGSVVTQNLGSLKIDSSFSLTSINAVQNKVVTAALNNKVDKVTGKQLSTEDFTSALKTKLESLNNYDDTEINNALSKLQTQLDTLVSGDASTAIESFNEIIAFLSGITDSEGLDAIIASIEQQIAKKVDKVEGKGLSTEDYTTKDKTKLEGIEEGAQKNVQSDWNEDDETSSAFIKNKPVIEVDTSMSDTSEKAVQNKVIKSYVDGKAEVLTEAILENEEVTANAFADISAKHSSLSNKIRLDYATKAEVDALKNTFLNEVVDNEEVTANALSLLEARLSIIENITNLT